MENDANCVICFETVSRLKILTCSHSFCESCLGGIIAKGVRGNAIPCPLCRICTRLRANPHDMRHLKTKILGPIPCDTCREPTMIKNLFWCPQCVSSLCESCASNDHNNHENVKPWEKLGALEQATGVLKDEFSALEERTLAMARLRTELDAYFAQVVDSMMEEFALASHMTEEVIVSKLLQRNFPIDNIDNTPTTCEADDAVREKLLRTGKLALNLAGVEVPSVREFDPLQFQQKIQRISPRMFAKSLIHGKFFISVHRQSTEEETPSPSSSSNSETPSSEWPEPSSVSAEGLVEEKRICARDIFKRIFLKVPPKH